MKCLIGESGGKKWERSRRRRGYLLEGIRKENEKRKRKRKTK